MSVNETGHVSMLEFGAKKMSNEFNPKINCKIQAYDYGQDKQLTTDQTIEFDVKNIFNFNIRPNPFFFSNSTGKYQTKFDRLRIQ